jgi:hypothetical protein
LNSNNLIVNNFLKYIFNNLKIRVFLILLTELFFIHVLNAQVLNDNKNFGPPLPLPERLSGSFGELRTDHFHAGIDYKTGEKEGIPVHAAAAGYVSRVKVSETGYGKVIYITHPDGIVTVYAHLSEFYHPLADTVEAIQQQYQKFALEIFPDKSTFPVNKGMLIGFSGNSGSSEGPHLHFETRLSASEKPFNPQMIGYNFQDTVPPVIKSVIIYEPGPGGALFNAAKRSYFVNPVTGKLPYDTIITGSPFFLGVETFDRSGKEPNPLGTVHLELMADDSLICSCSIDSFSFDQTRMINSHIDYQESFSGSKNISLMYKLPGNFLPFYENCTGMIGLSDNQYRRINLTLSDFRKNSTTLVFYVGKEPNSSKKNKTTGTKVEFGTEKIIASGKYKLSFDKNTFYETVWVKPRYTKKQRNSLSGTLNITPESLPVQQPVQLSMKLIGTDDTLRNKIVIIHTNYKGDTTAYKCIVRDGWAETRVRVLGKFEAVPDTVPPYCKAPVEELSSGGKKILRMKAGDNISGLSSYKCFINGQFVISEYKPLNDELIIYTNLEPNKQHSLEIELADYTNNHSNYLFLITTQM